MRLFPPLRASRRLLLTLNPNRVMRVQIRAIKETYQVFPAMERCKCTIATLIRMTRHTLRVTAAPAQAVRLAPSRQRYRSRCRTICLFFLLA